MPTGYPNSSPPCSIVGCTNISAARRLCSKHYLRWLTHGDPNTILRNEPGSAIRWLKEQIKENRDAESCWEWRFSSIPSGYGHAWFENQYIAAHQLALILAGHPRPTPESVALHSCDNPPCVNPAHLRWGTTKDNSLDMVQRGRSLVGSNHPRAKLTESQVREIKADPRKNAEIARDYGCLQTTVGHIKKGRQWKHVV